MVLAGSTHDHQVRIGVEAFTRVGAIRATAHLRILTEGATGCAAELRAKADGQIHADGAVVFTFPRHRLGAGAAGHGVDHPIEIFVALVGGAFEGQVLLNGETVRLAGRHGSHSILLQSTGAAVRVRLRFVGCGDEVLSSSLHSSTSTFVLSPSTRAIPIASALGGQPPWDHTRAGWLRS